MTCGLPLSDKPKILPLSSSYARTVGIFREITGTYFGLFTPAFEGKSCFFNSVVADVGTENHGCKFQLTNS